MPAKGNLLPAVLVANNHYLPRSRGMAAPVGATSFALEAAACLEEAGAFSGFILYSRQEGQRTPTLHSVTRDGLPCLVMRFNFSMHPADIRSALSSAAMELTRRATDTATGPPMLYYQTDTLLGYHPSHLPACVTHHGPFFDDFAEQFSEDDTFQAFGNPEKALHIMRRQELGLAELLAARHIFVIQHSRMQRDYLVGRGMDPARMREVSPPIGPEKDRSTRPAAEILNFIESAQLALCTAVARLDHFKNLDLLVSAGTELMDRGLPVKILLIGGDESDNVRRTSLLRDVPARHADRFLLTARLAKAELYSVFRTARRRTVFVCTSRYETLGITPLEAALSGLSTVVPHSRPVEAARFFPPGATFEPTTNGLVTLIEQLASVDLLKRGAELNTLLEGHISVPRFRRDLIRAWRSFSEMGRSLPQR
ncbi:glycosyltransferase [Streptomyces zingiberis]|uniref:Glycosyltransferase family 1 protein n=1 Tax=Streptomyces zingiberis TaxID=2053010 RepID=A0ABX1BV02_9ACTN|nr:glycosyltransferase [Streptomyces zingiberis]NJQ00268.1 glycosyltransferase family 1 protein [Streptomyces zingiberis]